MRLTTMRAPVQKGGIQILESQLEWVAEMEYAPSPVVLSQMLGSLSRAPLHGGQDVCAWIAETDQSEVVAVAFAVRHFECVDLEYIAVRPKHRGTGAGAVVLRRLHADCAACGAQRVLLEVAAGNEVARALYVKAGYAEIQRRPRYYRNGEDALVMEMRL